MICLKHYCCNVALLPEHFQPSPRETEADESGNIHTMNRKLKDEQFKKQYDEERELLEISIQLLNARKSSGLSQQELARKAHITQQQLSKIESGLNCNLATFLRVCHALKVKIDLINNGAVQRA